jgi:hypothetical protein
VLQELTLASFLHAAAGAESWHMYVSKQQHIDKTCCPPLCSLPQFGNANDRLLAVLDANGDLYMTRPLAQGTSSSSSSSLASSPTKAAAGGQGQQQQQGQQQHQQQRMVKLASNVSGLPVWHEAAPMLAAVVDGQLMVWYHPAAAFVDRDLLEATKSVHSDG